MPQIYVIYRPEDARKKSKEIIAILEKNYGASNVQSPDFDGYVDVYVIEKDIKMADYLLVIIGNYWADMVDESGMNLLNSVYDPVHMAIATAINSRKQVIPILVDGASMPHPSRLPRELRKLTTQEPIKLDKNAPLEKSLSKGLKDIIKQGSRIKVPSFVSQVAQTEKTPAQQLRQFQQQSQRSQQQPQRNYQHWMIRAVWIAIVIAVTVIIMAFVLLPTRRAETAWVADSTVAETSLQVTIVPPTLVPTSRPTLIMPTDTPSLPSITVENASQLALLEDRIATVSPTEEVVISQQYELFIFVENETQEVHIKQFSTEKSLNTISTAPYDPIAIQLHEDETQLLILLSNGQVMVWGVPAN